ncbi:phage tail tape measure protein [Pseudomonas brassicacearum]|uniref:Phage tail tape measure protein n=1 Tax=Pseudomonas brassicacearum TaxID=930166 RepID=A0A423IG17_9PSED|nr:phage tail tape measure protein [Pseudomonas brassicacearum]
MPGMLNLAAAGGADLAQTADIASNILSGLGMNAGQMAKIGDVMVGTFTRSINQDGIFPRWHTAPDRIQSQPQAHRRRLH